MKKLLFTLILSGLSSSIILGMAKQGMVDVQAKLFEQVEKGKLSSSELKLLLDAGVDVNAKAKDYLGDTALMIASRNGYKEIVELLIKNNADVNVKAAREGETALMYASLYGRKEIVELLIKNAKNNIGWAAWIWVFIKGNGHKEVVELLDAKDYLGKTALMKAVTKSNKINKEIVELLIKNNADVNTRANDGMTALIVAALYGCKEIMELLIKNNADVNTKANDGMTALIVAAREGRKEIVELLIKNSKIYVESLDNCSICLIEAQEIDQNKLFVTSCCKQLLCGTCFADNSAHNNVTCPTCRKEPYKVEPAIIKKPSLNNNNNDPSINTRDNVNAKDKDGRTALMAAALYGHKEIMELLIKNNAEVNARDNYGNTALLNACHKEVVGLLINNGADINAKNKGGMTTLIWASLKGRKEIVELLIKNKVDVNARNNRGQTALMKAALFGQEEIMELLIKNNADVNARDNEGKTALMEASSKEVVELLIKNNADLNVRDNEGKTALMLASRYDYKKDIVELLEKARRRQDTCIIF